jgi:hypothetical protein
MVRGLTNILKKWNEFLETPAGEAKMVQTFRDARQLLGDVAQFVKGLFDGVTQVLQPLARVAATILQLAAGIAGVFPGGRDKGTKDWEGLAYWLGIMAALKLTNITRLFTLMGSVLRNAGGLRSLVAALSGGGGKGAFLNLFAENGATPAKPMYTFEVNPRAAMGPGGAPGLPGAGRAAGRDLLRGAARFSAYVFAADVVLHLKDAHGNLIAATVNAAHDLTFGLVPKINVDEGRGERARQESAQARGGSTQDVYVDPRGFRLRGGREEALRTAGAEIIRAGTTQPVPFKPEDVKKLAQQFFNLGKAAGQEFVRGLDATHEFFTREGLLAQFTRRLGELKPQMRAAAEEQMIVYARGLERSGRLPRGSVEKLIKDIKAQFGTLPAGFRDPTKRGLDSIAAQFRRRDIVNSAKAMVAELKHTYDDFPTNVQFSAQTASQNFLTELEFLRHKAATSTGRLKDQANADFKAVQKAAKDYGHGANSAMQQELADMGVKGSKNARHVRNEIVKAFEQMVTGVGGLSNESADALYTALTNMGRNADSVLHALGLPLPKWRVKQMGEYVRQKTSHLPAQRGAYVPGTGDGDRVPAMLEPGEYVLNKKLVSSVGRHVLDRLNFGEVPRFQRGGTAPAWGQHPGLHGAIARAVGQIQARFPLQVASTTDHSRLTTSGNVSNHVLGLAADLSAAPDVMRRASAWIRRTMGSALLEGIHNPGLSIKGGKSVPPSFWGSAVWAQHSSHIHIALRSLAGAAAALEDTVRRQKIIGPPGAMRDATQAIADRVRRGLNRYIRGQDFGADTEHLSAGAMSKAQLRSLWVRARGPRNVANMAAAIALAESGGIPNRNNADRPGDGGHHIAAGLWQILGLPFEGNVYDPLTNARMAVAKYRGAGNTFRPWVAYTNGNYRQYMQRGGWLGGRGMTGPDTIPIGRASYAAPGEYVAQGPGGSAVFTQHQVPFVERALGGPVDMLPGDTRALPIIERALGGPVGLDRLFARVTRPHSMIGRAVHGAARFFKKGGRDKKEPVDPYKIGSLRGSNTFRVAAWDVIMGNRGHVARLQKEYEYYDRQYGQSEEILIDPETGAVNQDQVDKRVKELTHLEEIRVQIVEWLRKAASLARKIRDTYITIIGRLTRSLTHAKKKDRTGIEAQIRDVYQPEVQAWNDNIGDIRDEIRLAELDVNEIRSERAEVAGTQPEKREADTTADTTADADAEARAAQAEARAAAVTADLETARGNLRALLSPGDIGSGMGPGTALGAVRQDILGALGVGTYAGAASVTGAPGTPMDVAGGGYAAAAGPSHTINVYPQVLIPGSAETMHAVGRAVSSALDYGTNMSSPVMKVG